MSEIFNTYPKTFTVPEGAVKFRIVIHGKALDDIPNMDIQLNSGEKVSPDLSGEISITSEWGDVLAYCQDEIKQSEGQLTVPLYEPIWIRPSDAGAPSGGEGFKINGFNLYKDFGMIISEVNDYLNIPKRIDVGTTDYYKLTQYRESGVINLIGAFEGDGSGGLMSNIYKFYALMSSPNAKTFVMPDDSIYYIYAADGCQVSDIRDNYALFKMTLRQTTIDYI